MSLSETSVAYLPVLKEIDFVDMDYWKINFNPNTLDSNKISSVKSSGHLVSWSSQSLDFRDKDIPELIARELHLITNAIVRDVRKSGYVDSFTIIYGYETEYFDWKLVGCAYKGTINDKT